MGRTAQRVNETLAAMRFCEEIWHHMGLAIYDTGNPQVRFNERREETWLGVRLRCRRCAKAVGQRQLPLTTAGTLLPDSIVTVANFA